MGQAARINPGLPYSKAQRAGLVTAQPRTARAIAMTSSLTSRRRSRRARSTVSGHRQASTSSKVNSPSRLTRRTLRQYHAQVVQLPQRQPGRAVIQSSWRRPSSTIFFRSVPRILQRRPRGKSDTTEIALANTRRSTRLFALAKQAGRHAEIRVNLLGRRPPGHRGKAPPDVLLTCTICVGRHRGPSASPRTPFTLSTLWTW